MTNPQTSTQRFYQVATEALEVLFEADPVWAGELGQRRFDGRLPDLSAAGIANTARDLADATAAVDDLDDAHLDPQDQVDLEILRTRLTARLWAHDEFAERTWNPLLTLPDPPLSGRGRLGADPSEQVPGFLRRWAVLPSYLPAVRAQWQELSRPHLEAALHRMSAMTTLMQRPMEQLLASAENWAGPARGDVEQIRDQARVAIEQHQQALLQRQPDAIREPRLDPRDYAAKLWYCLDTETLPDPLLDRAESDLMAIEESLAEVAEKIAPLLGVQSDRGHRVQSVLAALAAGALDQSQLAMRAKAQLDELTELIQQHELVSIPAGKLDFLTEADPLSFPVEYQQELIFADSSGPLAEAAAGYLVIPAGELLAENRGLNPQLLRTILAHEAMPGILLQAAHGRSFTATTQVRAALRSEIFLQGWALYAEQLVVELFTQIAPGELGTLALQMQQLTRQLQATISAILDVRLHSRGLTELDGMALITGRGHYHGRAASALWHKGLLTSTELSAGYVGYQEIALVVRDLQAAEPTSSPRRIHDQVLAHGAPSPRLLRMLLGLPG